MNVNILTFMKVELGKTLEVIGKLHEIPEVKEIAYITGEYDLMFILECESNEQVQDLFIQKIEIIPGIVRSSSHLLVKRWFSSTQDTPPAPVK